MNTNKKSIFYVVGMALVAVYIWTGAIQLALQDLQAAGQPILAEAAGDSQLAQVAKVGTSTVKVVISKSSANPTEVNGFAGSRQIILGAFDVNVAGQGWVTLRNVKVNVAVAGKGGSVLNLSNVNISQLGGNPITYTNTISATSTGFYFDSIPVAKGIKTTFVIKGDIGINFKSGQAIQLRISPYKDWKVFDTATWVDITSPAFPSTKSLTFSAGITNVKTSGSYSVSLDLSPSYAYRMVKAGSTNVPLAAFKFAAGTTEDIQLRAVALQMAGVSTGSPRDLVGNRVTLWNGSAQVGEATFFKSGWMNDYAAYYATSTLFSSVIVPKSETVTLVVKGDLRPGSGESYFYAGNPGAFLAVAYDGNANGLATGNYAVGRDSSAIISPTNKTDIVSAGVRIFRNVPEVAVINIGQPSLAPGSDLYKVRIVNTDPNRDLVVGKLTFKVSMSPSYSFGSFLLYDNTGNVATSFLSEVKNGLVSIEFNDVNSARIIPAGGSKTFSLRASHISPAAKKICLSLVADKVYSGLSSFWRINSLPTDRNNFIWSPFSTTTPRADVSLSNTDWTNSYGMPGFPGAGVDMPMQCFTRPA